MNKALVRAVRHDLKRHDEKWIIQHWLRWRPDFNLDELKEAIAEAKK